MINRLARLACVILCVCVGSFTVPATFVATVSSQDTVTGAFEGTVTSSETGAPVAGAAVEIVSQQTGVVIPKRTDSRGRFYQGLLQPGLYIVRVSATGFRTREVVQRLFITRTGEVVPVPVSLDPVTSGAPPLVAPLPGVTPTPVPPLGPVAAGEQETDIRAKINATDARRDGSFSEDRDRDPAARRDDVRAHLRRTSAAPAGRRAAAADARRSRRPRRRRGRRHAPDSSPSTACVRAPTTSPLTARTTTTRTSA